MLRWVPHVHYDLATQSLMTSCLWHMQALQPTHKDSNMNAHGSPDRKADTVLPVWVDTAHQHAMAHGSGAVQGRGGVSSAQLQLLVMLASGRMWLLSGRAS